MNPEKRRTVIAGNWKMNFTPAEATAFINEVKPLVAGKDRCDIIFCAIALGLHNYIKPLLNNYVENNITNNSFINLKTQFLFCEWYSYQRCHE